ncbi:Uncharacterised protein [uncultured Flavonifractor sp.]|nr:Uncharacterised protein [uncultured Flavonifractor sp.]
MKDETVEARAVKIAARIMVADGLCRREDPEGCKRGYLGSNTCERCIRAWLMMKARVELAREEKEKMDIERAREILDPEHLEEYESLEPVNEACQMGRAALEKMVPLSPHPDGDERVEACQRCGSGEFLYNEDGNRNRFCGQCGQAIKWG